MAKKNITTLEVARAARKLQEEKDGKRIISDFSTPALREFAFEFENQYRSKKSRAGSVSKKKRGILLAALDIQRQDPYIDADSLWHRLDNHTQDFRWDLELDGDRLLQFDRETNKESSITYSTFVRHYFPKKK